MDGIAWHGTQPQSPPPIHIHLDIYICILYIWCFVLYTFGQSIHLSIRPIHPYDAKCMFADNKFAFLPFSAGKLCPNKYYGGIVSYRWCGGSGSGSSAPDPAFQGKIPNRQTIIINSGSRYPRVI